MAGLYIHIPFCRSRCIYCGFYSTTLESLRHSYVEAVCKEMEMRRDYIKDVFNTIYIGGGTPSLLDGCELQTIFAYIYKVFAIGGNPEVTIECNPDDVTPDFASMLSSLSVNRVSMGAQTSSDKRLKFLHRRHSAAEVDRAVGILRRAGIRNISIDLMFGFPEETLEDWRYDLKMAIGLGVEHISAYSLMYEEGTRLWRMRRSGAVKEVDEELSLAMYDELCNALDKAGYEHYEISNFAIPGFRSKHNSSYWNLTPYIGIGAAAHSFDINSRQWNVSDVRRYIDSIQSGKLLAEKEILDDDTAYDDVITTALRTCEGVSLDLIRERFGEKYVKLLTSLSKQYVDTGLLEVSDGHIRLTRKGIYVSDAIMSDLMSV